MNNWILVTDQLPPASRNVITASNDGVVRCGYMRDMRAFKNPDRAGKWMLSGHYVSNDVTHWMPLPEPPK